MTFPPGGFDENNYFHHGTFDAVRGNLSAPSGRGSPFHSLGESSMETCKFNTVIGKLPPETKLGDGNTIVNAADENGNVIINTPMAVGYGAKASPGSVAIGAFASAGIEAPASQQLPKPSFWFHPVTKTFLSIFGAVIYAFIVWFFGFK